MAGDGSPSYSYEFDGLDGQGDPVSMCVEMNARVYFDKLGEVHILQTDVEARGGGIEVTRLDGPGAPDRTIYWDDTPLSEPRDTEVWPGLDGTAGVDSEGGTHGWDYHENGWGNERLIDDWAYLPLDHAAAEITVGGTCLEITKTSTAGADTRPGDVVTYEVTATNTGDGDYTEAAPAVVVDDLSAVLDDAELVAGSVSADRGGDLDVTATTVTWSGPLAAGESVTVSYDVELVAGGDGELRNVAWEPFDPEDPLPPTCDPAVDGRDAVTGEPCAVTEHELPRLTIEKTADRTELPALGEELTYTVTLTSAGPGDFTADSPAAFSDDLSGVLDDADLVEGSVSASTGTADVSGDLLTWEGTLAAGEAATVSYTVVYTAAGDRELTNLACIDPRDALDPAQVCDVVSVPGSGLEWTKSVDPASGTPVEAGEELTYTLTFANVGNTAASVDTTDDLTGVLDDAELVSGPTAEDGLQADLAGGTVTITGEVPAGESRTVTYTVRVLELDEVGGDGVLTNALACPAGAPEPCAPEVTENPVRALDVTKSAEPVEGVDTGDVVTYTVRVTNVGEGGYTADSPAIVVDDMTGLLDDARYLGDAAVTTGVGELDWTSPHLTWTGPLAAGQTVEVTYSVQVTNTGDHLLANTVGPVCATDLCPPPVTVELPLPYVVPGKSSDPEPGTGLSAGDEVTYLLTWTNTGQATGRVDATDDLSGVLDDAVLSGGPTVVEGDLTVTFDEGGLRVEGELAPGADAAVSYTVTVLPDGERADNLLDNVLMPDVPQMTCEDGECAEVPPPATSHPVGELDTAKSADPESGATVRAGQEVTYVLTFRSLGEASVAVDHEDVLSGVLDDATLVDGPTASTPALEVSGPDDTGRIAVGGVLAAGDVETVTYTVRVLPEGERGDDLLANFLVGAGEDAPEECGAEDPRCTVHEVVDPSDDPGAGAGTGSGSGLPRTGLDVVGPAAAAVLLLTAGLLAVTRRRSVG